MSATIYSFVSDAAFGPDVTSAMGEAFDRANAVALELGRPALQELIALRIIQLARAGERDPNELCVGTLQYLGLASPAGASEGIARAINTLPDPLARIK